MKRVLSLLVLLTWHLCVAAQTQPDPYSQPQRAERVRNYDVEHYEIHLRFDEKAKTFWGDDTVTLFPTEDGFDKCVLDTEILKVTDVRGAGGGDLKFAQDSGSLTVLLSKPFKRNEKVSFTVSYVSQDPRPDPLKYGMPVDYHLGLTFWPETSDHPALVTSMSFPEGARHWFPSNDVPADKATSGIYITVSEKESAVSNGRLVEVKENREQHSRTFHWAQEKPHSTYLFVIALGPYQAIADTAKKVPLHYWVYPKDVPNASRSFTTTAEIIDFFEREFGYPYPWAKYDQITIPGIGGGAESTSATVLSQGTIHDARAEQDFPSAWLVAHEAAHQWWGDLVTFRTWSDTWLNEGFATYSEYLFNLHSAGEDEASVNLLNKKLSYLGEAHGKYMRPIVFDRYQFPNDLFDRHSYEKGALVLNMLHFVIGDDAFRQGIKLYLERHAFDSVDTSDLRKCFEESSGQQLGWFFDEWVYRPGHPVLSISYRWDEAAKKIMLHVEQKQDRVHDTPIFRMPVLVSITTAEGKSTKKIWIDKQVDEIELDVPSKPLLVRFDEGNQLLSEMDFAKGEEELLYGLTHDDVIGRMWAAGQLAQHVEDAEVTVALKQAAKKDSFWAVRASAVDALAKSVNPDYVAFFREAALDKNSKVRVAALRALGPYRDRNLLQFLIERYRQDDSYLAQAEALRGIGECGSGEQVEFLKGAATVRSPRNVVKNAADEARARIASQENASSK